MLMTLLNPFAEKAKPVSGTRAVELVESGEAALIDVRELAELRQSGHARGAINIPLGALRERADPRNASCEPSLVRAQAVIVYCATGARSAIAGKLLRKLGHNEVYDLGSLGNWQAAGGQIST